ncbi:MAG: chemotaxis protein CheD, partial [Alcaligenaceae bacterium]|nr:chemotaxis protein CheD [Alcaligenaceae bacterium]
MAVAAVPSPGSSDGAQGRALERSARVINPGGWAVEGERAIATLLGSCVAVCLYDPKLRLAGMNHFLLPTGNRRDI